MGQIEQTVLLLTTILVSAGGNVWLIKLSHQYSQHQQSIGKNKRLRQNPYLITAFLVSFVSLYLVHVLSKWEPPVNSKEVNNEILAKLNIPDKLNENLDVPAVVIDCDTRIDRIQGNIMEYLIEYKNLNEGDRIAIKDGIKRLIEEGKK